MPSRPTIRATRGLVAAGHHLATGAGLAALREGGTAADAAATAAFVCCVVLPHRSGIGGDAFALVHDARTRRVAALNGSGAAPAAVSLESFPEGFPPAGAALLTVPGLLACLADLLERHGTFDLARALAPAIELAEEGFAVSEALSAAIEARRQELGADPGCAEAFLPRGRVPRPGEVLAQPDLARTLRALARHGVDAFYRGELGERFAAAVAAAGGALAADDLAVHRTAHPEPLVVEHRGLRVYGQPPMSQGHILMEELAIVADDDLAALGWGSAALVHLMVEAKKLAFADRAAHAGDVPEFDPHALIAAEHARSRRGRIGGRAADNTTYLAVVDRDANAVSLIESVFSEFGAAFLAPGTGILGTDRLTGFALKADSPNALAPRKRPVHTLNTVLVTDGERARFVFGTPGRHAQVQTNFQLTVALIDFGMGVQEAIDAPRWYHERGRELHLEARFREEVRRALEGKGHRPTLLADWDPKTGGAQAIAVDPETGVFAGGADPRREGYAAGY